MASGDVAVRQLCLLHDIGEILKSDECEECQQAAEANAGQGQCVQRRHLRDRRGDGQAGMNARNDDGYQPADLDDGEQARQRYRFQNAPRGHRAEREDNRHRDEPLRQIDELLDIAGGSKGNGGG